MRWKADLDVVIVDDEVDRAHEIEGEDERPEERANPHREKRQHGQKPGCKIAVRCELSESRGQVVTYNTRKEEYEPEKAEAV